MEPLYHLAAWRTPRASSNSAAKRIFHGRERTIGSPEDVARFRSEVLDVLGPGAWLEADSGMLMIAVPDRRLREASAELLATVASVGYLLYDPQVGRLVVPMTQMAAPWPPEWTGPIGELRAAIAAAATAADLNEDRGGAAELDVRAVVTDLAAQKGWGIWEVGAPLPDVEHLRHVAPDLEALIPSGLVESSLRPRSVRATRSAPAVSRALKAVSVRPRDAAVVSALGGHDRDVHTITLFSVPGVGADELAAAFEPVIFKPRRARWERREISGRGVWWAEAKGFFAPGLDFTAAWWTRDGLVVWITGQPAWLETAVARLP